MTRSQIIDLDGPVHYVDHGGDGPPMVLLHGLGGSHLNWLAVAPGLARTNRVYALDLAGFGLTPLSGRRATVEANRSLLDRFIATVSPDEPVTLVGNSMGGLISMMEAAAAPEKVAAAVLVTPALPPVTRSAVNRNTMLRIALPVLPGIGPVIADRYQASISPERQVDETFEMLCVDARRVPREVRRGSIEMTKLRRDMEWAVPAFVEASRSIALLFARRRRFMSMLHRISCPVLVVHGEHDVIVPAAAARWLRRQRPDFRFEFFQDAGHIPQIETGDAFVEAVDRFLEPAAA
jgi:pimeloyl-ACP methyl ester carboxylesterase